MRAPVAPEVWFIIGYVDRGLSAYDVPPGAVPGTRLCLSVTDVTPGGGVMLVQAAEGDWFCGTPGTRMSALALTMPGQRCHLEYARVPVEGEKDATAGVWYMLAE